MRVGNKDSHITLHLNQAVDPVRRAEYGRLRGRPLAKRLKKASALLQGCHPGSLNV
jgi:hypothetical protein